MRNRPARKGSLQREHTKTSLNVRVILLVSARREEETAFLCMEQVLGVDIKLADAGGGDKRPDGIWVDPGCSERCGIVEVASPPWPRRR